MKKASRFRKSQPNPANKGRQPMGFLSADATEEEIEAFVQHIKQFARQQEQEQAKEQDPQPRKERTQPVETNQDGSCKGRLKQSLH